MEQLRLAPIPSQSQCEFNRQRQERFFMLLAIFVLPHHESGIASLARALGYTDYIISYKKVDNFQGISPN